MIKSRKEENGDIKSLAGISLIVLKTKKFSKINDS